MWNYFYLVHILNGRTMNLFQFFFWGIRTSKQELFHQVSTYVTLISTLLMALFSSCYFILFITFKLLPGNFGGWGGKLPWTDSRPRSGREWCPEPAAPGRPPPQRRGGSSGRSCFPETTKAATPCRRRTGPRRRRCRRPTSCEIGRMLILKNIGFVVI